MTNPARTIAAVLCAVALAACSEREHPLAPRSAPPASLATAPAIDAERDGANEDMQDALDRLYPAVAHQPGAEALGALLRQLATGTREGTAAERGTANALAALERLERSASEEAAADIGALRLVLEARQ